MKKGNQGITLIALVITIIVLLILTAVSIQTLTGENGILTKADDVKNSTTIEEEKEQIKLAYNAVIADRLEKATRMPVTATELQTELTKQNTEIVASDKEGEINQIQVTFHKSGNIYTIDGSNGKVQEVGGGKVPTLPETDDTKPYLPTGASVDKTYNTLDDGFVIIDNKGNEWVWIEVPKSIYTNTEYNEGTAPTSEADYDKIESIMQKYAQDYRNSGYKDIWYDECGLSENDYTDYKNRMLKSVYENGGFYIARYEAGIKDGSIRTAHTDITSNSPKAVSKIDQIPYNWIYCKEAQTLAMDMGSGTGRTTSLMFGIQWDLVLKYIETKGKKTQRELREDSSSWGNYNDGEFYAMTGKYSEDNGRNYIPITGDYLKIKYASKLFTTGASKKNNVLGIYDLAGNVYEWTLEKYINGGEAFCTYRSGAYNVIGGRSVIFRGPYAISYSNHDFSFRSTLW